MVTIDFVGAKLLYPVPWGNHPALPLCCFDFSSALPRA